MVKSNISIENAQIGFRNFSGLEGDFNPAGRRNFCVFLETDLAKTLEEDGWNVRWLEPLEDGDKPQAYLQVAVQFGKFPPQIVLITSKGKTTLDEKSINLLDTAELENVDLIIRPYNWTVNKKNGVKAYLKNLYVTLHENEFEKKYKDVPDSAISSLTNGN